MVLLESRGYLVGSMMAAKLHCGIVLMRKAGKLPGATYKITYNLEYKKGE